LTVHTDGGSYIAGAVDIGGGQVIGRHQITQNLQHNIQQSAEQAEQARALEA
jgi:hypothetical protein